MRFLVICSVLMLLASSCTSRNANQVEATKTKGVQATLFVQSCQVDSDCVVVRSGGCNACGYPCPNAAINRSDLESYDRALKSLNCQREENVRCEPCLRLVAQCKNNSCVAVADQASPLDQ